MISPVLVSMMEDRPGIVRTSSLHVASHVACFRSISSVDRPKARRPAVPFSLSTPMARKLVVMPSRNFLPYSVSARPGRPYSRLPSSLSHPSAALGSNVLADAAISSSHFLVSSTPFPVKEVRASALSLKAPRKVLQASALDWSRLAPASAFASPSMLFTPVVFLNRFYRPSICVNVVSRLDHRPGVSAPKRLAPLAILSRSEPTVDGALSPSRTLTNSSAYALISLISSSLAVFFRSMAAIWSM